jgi:molybdopterin/thiamine biosynthesis adenylyltransferase
MCSALRLPLIMGGTFAQSFTVDTFLPGNACFSCSDDMLDKEVLSQIVPSKIQTLQNLSFIPRNKNPIG